jgi:hypothetical protein
MKIRATFTLSEHTKSVRFAQLLQVQYPDLTVEHRERRKGWVVIAEERRPPLTNEQIKQIKELIEAGRS